MNGFTPAYWVNALMLSSVSHPATVALLHVAVEVGRSVAMHFKAKYNRPRPGQLYPALMSPVPSPGHPSYPNAHMLQARLMSLLVCMAEQAFVAADGNRTIVDRLKVPDEASRWPFLAQLADRVGQNREIAGLHYPSDTAAGTWMADQIADLLVGRSALLTRLLQRANKELTGEVFLP